MRFPKQSLASGSWRRQGRPRPLDGSLDLKRTSWPRPATNCPGALSISGHQLRRQCIPPNGSPMKYLGLAYFTPEKFAAMAPDDVKELVSQCPALDENMRATGKLLVSASLG